MAAKILDGGKLAAKTLQETEAIVSSMKQRGVAPTLAVVLVGNDPASELYVEKKKLAAETLGITLDLFRFKETVSERELIRLIDELNHQFDVHGILVQLPLPKNVNRQKVINAISPLKDADGFTAFSLGLLGHGEEGIVSCTASAILKLIESSGAKIEGSSACIVNHGIVVGRPLSQLLLNRNATVTVCNHKTKDLGSFTKQADILVTAVGKPGLITKDMVKPGAVVIDAGIAKADGKTRGDVDFDSVKEVASSITPVPGGVGPMTVACLMENVAKLASMHSRH